MKKSTCKRGHDTSYPEARDAFRTCKQCRKTPERLAYKNRWRRSTTGRISKMKAECRYQIKQKTLRIRALEQEIERLRNGEEISY